VRPRSQDGVDCEKPGIDVVRKRTEASIEEEPSAMEVAADSPDPARREMTEELKRLLECVGRLEPDRQKLVLLGVLQRLEPRTT